MHIVPTTLATVSTTSAAPMLPHTASPDSNTKVLHSVPAQLCSYSSTAPRVSISEEIYPYSVTQSQGSEEESRNSHCMSTEVTQPFKISHSLNPAKANNHRTTFPSAPSQYQLQLSEDNTSPASFKHYGMNQGDYIDNDSLLLLANFATLTTSENENPFTQQSMTSTLSMDLSSSACFETHHSLVQCAQSAQDCCKATSFPPAISCSSSCCQGHRQFNRGSHEQLNQSVNFKLQSYDRDVPQKQFSTIPELETQVSSLRYPTENFQTHLFSEKHYHVHLNHDILNNQ